MIFTETGNSLMLLMTLMTNIRKKILMRNLKNNGMVYI